MEQSDLEAGENDAGVTVDVEMEPEPTPPSLPRSTADRDMDVSEPSPAHPLYSGAQIEEGMGVMLLLSLAMRHKLTYTAFADIIKVINIHLPKKSALPPPTTPCTASSNPWKSYHLQTIFAAQK